MFSLSQKQKLAEGVEKLLLDIGHPEMPTARPQFTLNVVGKEPWSWAEIHPNWTFDETNTPNINPHNEEQERHSRSNDGT